MAADQGLIDSVSNDNTKTVAGQPAILANVALANQVSHQNRMLVIAEAAVGNIVRRLTELDPSEAASVLKTTQGDLAAQMTALLSSLATGQQSTKVAQTTPPTTP
jgi:hypothetical protein